jgi:hypothetical protein
MQVAGFSGTNDNEPLLPLTVKYMSSEDKHIQATDGRMVCVINRPGKCTFTPLISAHEGNLQQQPAWSRLLDLAIEKQAHALIDAGELPMPRPDLLPCGSFPSHSSTVTCTLTLASSSASSDSGYACEASKFPTHTFVQSIAIGCNHTCRAKIVPFSTSGCIMQVHCWQVVRSTPLPLTSLTG